MADTGQALREAFDRFDAALAVAQQAVADALKCGCTCCK